MSINHKHGSCRTFHATRHTHLAHSLHLQPFREAWSVKSGARERKAFTLIEVLITMVLFILLVGGLVALVQGSLKAATDLTQQQKRQEKLSGLIELCQRTFRNLPSTATFEAVIHTEDGYSLPEIILKDASDLLSMGESSVFMGTTTLAVRPQTHPETEGLFKLSLLRETAREDLSLLTESEKSKLNLALISDLKKIQWRFYDPKDRTWSDDWNDIDFRPGLIELTLILDGESDSLKAIFWLPPISVDES